jgi:tetratricopeptide (TPR) repeat protein
MNVLDTIDEKGAVTGVALEAQIALEAGDTIRSAQLFKQAGEMLESSVARLAKPSERDLARFLAATHYFKGGAYNEAARICDRIHTRRLPARVRHLYPPFLKDVRERSAPIYTTKYEMIIKDYYRRVRDGDRDAAQKAIDLLIAHPYLLPRERMAHWRARCCNVLGLSRSATLFYRDAWLFDPDDLYSLVPYLDSLCKEERYAEAWKVVEGQLANRPSVQSSIYAILVAHRQLSAAKDIDREQLLTTLSNHFDRALESYRAIPNDKRMRLALLMDWGASLTSDIYRELKALDRYQEIVDRWIDALPDSASARVVRGIATYPGESSRKDLYEAIRLKSSEPWPYYLLAQEALLSGDFQECDRLCSQALKRNRRLDIRANLLSWQAFSRWELGLSPSREIRRLFAEARKLKPDDPLIANYARAFEENGRASDPPSHIPPEEDRQWREQAERYVNEYSMKRFEETIPILDASLV